MNECLGTKSRNINIEVLRICTMLMIIMGHSIGHTHLLDAIEANSTNYYLISALSVICYVATNVYVVISGYFLCEKVFSVKKVLMLWAQVFFYSTGIYMIFVLIGIVPFKLSELLKAIMPISGNQYWFARVYLGMYLLAPFINIFVHSMSKKQYQLFLIMNVVLFSFWRSFIPFAVTLNAEGGNSIIWFVILYTFAAYIRLHGTLIQSWKKNLVVAGVLLMFAFATRVGITLLSNIVGFNGKGASLFTEFTSFPMLFAAIHLFVAFLNVPKWREKIRIKRLILWLSGSTFGVYLIHENIYLKKLLWKIIDMPKFAESPYIILIIFVVGSVIFLITTIVDKIMFTPVKKVLEKISLRRVQAIINNCLYGTKVNGEMKGNEIS